MLETAEMPAAGAAGGNGSPQARFFHGFLTLIQGFPPHKSVSGHMPATVHTPIHPRSKCISAGGHTCKSKYKDQGIEKCSKHHSDMYWPHYGPVRPGAADLSGPRVPQASR